MREKKGSEDTGREEKESGINMIQIKNREDYMYIFVNIYVCVFADIYVCMYICEHICMYIYEHICMLYSGLEEMKREHCDRISGANIS